MKPGRIISAIAALLMLAWTASAAPDVYDGIVEITPRVYDFGDVSVDAGPLSCSFTVKNISEGAVAILQVGKTCGCTDVSWTREPLRSGESGKINVTYSNEDGPMPFEKSLNVYISGVSHPIILKIRGVVHEKKKPLAEVYPVRRGAMGLKSDSLFVGNLEQGRTISQSAKIANLSKSPLKISFTDTDPHVKISSDPATIPPGATATLTVSVASDRALWGRNVYTAVPVVNGKAGEPLRFYAVTKENFSTWTDAERGKGSVPMFDGSTVEFGKVKKGGILTLSFKYTNKGKSAFHIYKTDSDFPVLEVDAPDTKAAEKGLVTVRMDSSKIGTGIVTLRFTLITNSPLRPVITLFAAGEILP